MSKLIRYLVLPSEITPFERTYLARINRIALVFFALHPPAFALVAYLCGTSMPVAFGLGAVALVGPSIAYVALRAHPRLIGVVFAITAMLMGGILAYVGQGPMQIEMHFYFFVLIALLAVFANPMVVVAAAVTVALHHLFVWLWLPRGVFNYDASIWTVLVHAIFVVLESVAACFVARSFFDNVIGLERIVAARTVQLDARNSDMTRILDNVAQGFVSIELDGRVGGEWSRALETWFGAPAPGAKIWDYLGGDEAGPWLKMGFDALADGIMPVELTLEQLPHRIARDGRELRIDYRAIGEPISGVLVMVSDVTAEVARERAEALQRELMTVVEKAFKDRTSFAAFVTEAAALIDACIGAEDDGELRRIVHTLKGNCALFGVTSVAGACHALEDRMQETGATATAAERAHIAAVWAAFRERTERVLGAPDRRILSIDREEFDRVVAAFPTPEPPWASAVRDWDKVPTRARLEQCADYARALAQRLGKGDVDIDVRDHGLRVPERFGGVWAAFVHAVRNTVDHGIEPSDARAAAGKPSRGSIVFETSVVGGELHLAIADDGAGIDWDRLAEKARERGLAASTPDECIEALFAAGVSTAAQVTDTSGRGVGMDALRTACRALGGRIEVASQRGEGTRITCVLPLATGRLRRPSVVIVASA